MRKLLFVLLCLLFSVSLCAFTACSDEPTPEEVIIKAHENFAEVSSATYDITMDMSMSFLGEAMDITLLMKAEQTSDPLVAKVVSSTDMGMGFGSVNTTVYVIEEDGVQTTYTGMDFGEGMFWQKAAVDSAESANPYDAAANAAFYAEHVVDVSFVATEEVNGVSADRYDAVSHAVCSGCRVSEIPALFLWHV